MLYRSEQFFRVFSRIDLSDGLTDETFRVNHISDSLRVLSRRIIARAVGHPDFSISVTEQFVRKVELFGKGSILFFCIKTNTKNFDILVAVLLDSITESNTFSRSARGVGFRVKP